MYGADEDYRRDRVLGWRSLETRIFVPGRAAAGQHHLSVATF